MKKGETGVIAASNVTVSFLRWGQSVKALDDVTLNVSPGEWVLLVGPNGAGKSTLLKVLAGYTGPDKGDVRISGRKVHGLRARQLSQTVFMVHQDPLLGTASLLTVFENIFVADSTSASAARSKSKVRARYVELLAPLGLAERIDQPVKLLSGGERQLLALLVAGLRDAAVILLDEPLAALDSFKTELCIQQIEQMHRRGKTVVQIAHDTHLLEERADRIVTLTAGRVTADNWLRQSARLTAG